MATIKGTAVADLLISGQASDRINGLGGNDLLFGGAGNDTLDGGAGNDTLNGGAGNDIYLVSAGSGTDTIVEARKGGTDTVLSSISFSLAGIQHVENLTLRGSADINGTGNELDNTISGNSGDNRLDGGAGNDVLKGGAGNDVLVFRPGDSQINGGGGEDTLTFPGAGRTLDLADVPDGTLTRIEVIDLRGTGNNSLTISSQQILDLSDTDTLRVRGNAGDAVNAGTGWTQIENITIGSQTYAQYINGAAKLQVDLDIDRSEVVNDDVLIGDGADNYLGGGGGNDTLDGGTGADTLDGGTDDDVYRVDEADAPTYLVLRNWHGADYLFTPTTGTFTVTAGDDFGDSGGLVDTVTTHFMEPVIGGGHFALVFVSTRHLGLPLAEGHYQDATRYPFEPAGHPGLWIGADGSGANQSYGEFTVLEAQYDYGGDAPQVSQLVVDFAYAPEYSGPNVTGRLSLGQAGAGDQVVEEAGAGSDSVMSSVTYVLPANVEHLELSGNAAIDGLGNELDNEITGNGAANALFGGAGNDMLDGGGGADLMAGGTGDDSYIVDSVQTVSLSLSNWGGADYTFSSAAGVFRVHGADSIFADGDTLPDTVSVSYSDSSGQWATIEFSTRMLGTPFTEGSYLDAMRFPFESNGHPGLWVAVNGSGANTSTGSFTVVEADFGPAFEVRELLANFTYSGDGGPVVTGTLSVNGGRGDGIFERTGEGTDTVYSALDYVLGANLENLVLTGGDAVSGVGNSQDNVLTGNGLANFLTGHQGDDTLIGNGGNDTLVGGAGADLLDGGGGDDRFVIDALDTLVDGSGRDVVVADFDYTLQGGFEDLVLGGTGDISGTGNDDSNVLTGNDGFTNAGVWLFDGHNSLFGLGGNDTIYGASGNDTLEGGEGDDFLFGEDGSDVLVAAGADRVDGGEGNDRIVITDLEFVDLDGGEDTDTLALAGAGIELDLAAVATRTSSIEVVDLTGLGHNRLIVDDAEIVESFGGTLRVNGDAGDVVEAAGDWTLTGKVEAYNIFIKGAATLEVHEDVTFANEAPVASPDTAVATEGAAVVIGSVAGNDSDPDSTVPLTYELDSPVAGLTLESDGSYSFDPSHEAYDSLAESAAAEIVASYTVSDREGGSATTALTITLTGVNDAPVNSSRDAQTFGEFGDFDVFEVSIKDVDIGTGHLTIDLSTDIGSLSLGTTTGLSFVQGDGSSDTSIEFSGTLADINAALASLLFHSGEAGTGTITLTSTDEDAGSDTNTIHVTVASDLHLDALDGTNGFRIWGEAAEDQSGGSVSLAGDFNGDGYGDVIVGASAADPHYTDSGASYVVFGSASGFGPNLALSSLDGGNGFQLSGEVFGGFSGRAVSSAGDLNGDGYGDVIVGASLGDPLGIGAGASYIVFGTASGLGLNLDLSTLGWSSGTQMFGEESGDQLGNSVSSAGDVNGDGYDDLIVGAYKAGGTDAGAAYVVFGSSELGSFFIAASNLNGGDGLRLSGEDANDRAGFSVAGAGDVNGDGYDDLIVGADGAEDSGAAYVVFGAPSGFPGELHLSALNGTNGFRLSGVAAGDEAGRSVSGAGDVNGDGYADLIVGARSADTAAGSSGASYVVFGSGTGFVSNVDLSALDGTSGFRISGETDGDWSGYSVSAAGDVNGDGYDDVIVGALFAEDDSSFSGASYVIFGAASGFASNIDLAALDSQDGFKISGEAPHSRTGQSVSAAGDVNGDGFHDLIIGASASDSSGMNNAGSSFVVFGRDFRNEVEFQGDVEADALTGAGRLIGGGGDDILTGAGPADVFRGGQGDDRIVVADAGFFDVDGGSGNDMLALGETGFELDLTTFGDTKITRVEGVDLNAGSGAHTLTLSLTDLLNLSDTSNTLMIEGGGTDVVGVTTGEWTDMNVVGDYHVYRLGAAELRINVAITNVEITLDT